MFNFFSKKERNLDAEINGLGQEILKVIKTRYGKDCNGDVERTATIMSCIGVAIACTKYTNANPGGVTGFFLKSMMENFPGMGKFVTSEKDVLDLLKEDEKPIGFCPPNVTKH
jgi:hypothetical protein